MADTSDKRIKGLAHVNLNVRDMKRSLDFYCGLLGFENVYEFQIGSDHCAFITMKGITIELHQGGTYDESLKDGHFDHIAFAVEDINGVVASLKEKGIKFESDVISTKKIWPPMGSAWCLFRGPDGEHLEINEIFK